MSRKLFRQKKHSIRVRLTAWYMVSLAVTLICFSSYLYLELKKNLLIQVDNDLNLTSTEILKNIGESNGELTFFDYADKNLAGFFAVRLIAPEGKIWDSFGNYQELTTATPITAGLMNVTGKLGSWRVYTVAAPMSGWLQVGRSMNSIQKALQHLLKLIVLGIPFILMLTGWGGWFLANRALNPINRIIVTAQSISATDFTKRIGERGPTDEIGRLAMTIDKMLDRLQAGFERERRFTADAAHELRTPLTVIKGRIGVTLNRSRTPEEYEKTLEDLELETDKLIRLANGLLFLTRIEQTENQPVLDLVDLTSLLITLIEQMQSLAEAQKIQLSSTIASNLFLPGNSDYLTRLFLNLLDNALKYTPSNGIVKVKAFAKSDRISIEITDTGIGIAPEHLTNLFKRFYRVEDARSRSTGGAGLGLAIAYEIARLHGGDLTVTSEKNRGSVFTVNLKTST